MRKLCCFLALSVIAITTHAQVKIKAVNPARMLSLPAVAKDLGLTDDQRVTVKSLTGKFMQEIRALQGEGITDLNEMQDRINAVSNDIQKDIDTLLTPAQAKRLSELNLQIGSPNAAFLEPNKTKLGITKEQSVKADLLDDDLTEETGAIQMSSDNQEAKVKARTELTEKYRVKFEALLNEKQLAMLKEMKGKPMAYLLYYPLFR